MTVYRELRRLADTETAHGLSVEFAAVHDAADAGDWAGYVNAQGGPFVRRDDLQVRTLYESLAPSLTSMVRKLSAFVACTIPPSARTPRF
ncbi:hypothetical protein LNP74_08480 [Klebsiella pneumoniae subsp. pneumoniae]|nr:hypothetical protein [Klebsiella pneumoniae subsp. pneumoniae]